MTVRLALFGSPTLHDGGASIALPFERRNQLLAFLALKRSWVGRAELAALLWPEQEAKLAYTNLRKTLFRLQSFAWAKGIEVQGSALRFEADTDVLAFETALREEHVVEALALRSGELLAGFDDDRSEAWTRWLAFERDRLRLAWRGAALARLEGAIEPGEGVDLSARLLEDDPLDEAALRVHMTWLARGGHASRARKAYRDFVERIAADLGLAPSVELRALHDALGTSEPLPLPARTPAESTSDANFVGRTVELRQIADLLKQESCRLVTLTGPGGVGKTRLAQRALRDLAPAYAHGGAFVPLEDMGSASELGGRLARELGVGLSGSADPRVQVERYLREREMLLVLDNFEHLTHDAPVLEALLHACPGIRMIVTSRVRLGLRPEWSVPVEGLACPEAEDHDVIEAFDAVRMFVQAARRVEPAFVATVEADAIIEICRRVEGLPLALQLAATWTRVLSCAAIAAELRRGTQLLHAAGAQPPRHAGIDVVFDHSWRLLNPAERDALVRLSVFREGFTPAAARAVAAAPLPVLGALIDKSLLRKAGSRNLLHPLVQQFAAARLGDGETRTATEAAHARYFVLSMSQLQRAIDSGDRDAMREMDTEFENCRSAWQWAVAHGAVDEQLQCMGALFDYCDHRCRFEEGLQLVRAALESERSRKHAVLQARLLARFAHIQFRLDRYADAEATALQALGPARQTRDFSARFQCLSVLGSCCLRVGRHDDALRHYRDALKHASAHNHLHGIAASLDHVSLVLKWMGRYDEALRMSLESLTAHRSLGDVAGEALCLNNHAALYLAKQDYVSAGTYLRESLVLCDRDGLVGTRLYVLANLTEVALKAGDATLADHYATRALEVATTLGNRPIVAWMKLQLARLALLRADLPTARAELGQSLEITIALAQQGLRIGSVIVLAEVLEAQNEVECARLVLAFAAKHPSTSVPDRDEASGRLALLPAPAGMDAAWPAIELDELLHRIVAEASLAYGPLIAVLRGRR
jgi:predicted ATPase/DNA-binding SARP family transcriptional activator/Tfp pilus assembly protein PilF